MAALSNVPTVPNTPLLNRYDDGNTNGNTKPPSGPCNYKNLNIEGNITCGCRRFTDKALELHGYGHAPLMRPGWCVCEHHSCFHDHDPVDGHRATGEVSIAEGASMTPTKQLAQAQPPAQLRYDVHMQDMPEVGRAGKLDSLPDTLQWSRFIKSGDSQGSLPAIPSQCLLPSDNGSRASSSQTGYGRPFAGKGLQTLNHISKSNSGGRDPSNLGKGHALGQNGKIMQAYEDSNGHGFLQSLTEVATPSARSSQDLDAEVLFGKNVTTVQNALQRIEEDTTLDVAITMPPSEAPGSIDLMRSVTLRNDSNDENLLPKIRSIINHVADYPMTRRNHEHRLDELENASFHNGAVDNLREDHELLETRVGDVETRLLDVEKQLMAQSDTNSVASRQLVASSIDSRSSSALIASAIDHMDSSRVEALEAQIVELQAIAPPTHARPWEVEVVFIPFGPLLRGIWSTSQPSITQLSRVNSASGDEWTQTQHNSMAAAQARLTAHDQGVAWETSAADLSDQPVPWLMSKACGLGSTVDERLRSRGLVRKVLIKGPDARDVQAAMLSAFGDLPGILAEDPYSHRDHNSSIPDSMAQYIGLQAPWIPLRKLHKNSCLRFLNTTEMVTPALWTVQFLSSSVAMRSSGVRRLYVTQSDSYIQHLGSTVEWTWQKIRQLDRVYLNSSINHTPEGDADEPCWLFDERYDPPPSLNSSLTSASSHHSLTIRPISYSNEEDEVEAQQASRSDHFSSNPASRSPSTTPTSIPARQLSRNFSSSLKERHPFRPIHTRTTSLPITSVPIKSSPSQLQTTKRRIPSFESSPTRPANLNLGTGVGINTKRQRTRSPSHPRDTPRYSVPPSPSPFLDDYKRQTTPFAYATPHSNAPYIPHSSNNYNSEDDEERGSTTDDDEGGERNALSDYSDQGHQDEEWEGVQEEGFALQGLGIGLHAHEHDGEGEGEGSDSCPSEYPSRQVEHEVLRGGETKAGFRIHVDDEVDGAY